MSYFLPSTTSQYEKWFHVNPQLKTKCPEVNSEISWNLSQFPEIEEGHSVLNC